MLKKPYILALMNFGLILIVGIVMLILEYLFKINAKGVGLTLQIVVPFSIGQAYGTKYKQPIPHQLKLWTSICYILIWMPWTIMWLIIFAVLGFNWPAFLYPLAFLVITGINILLSPLMYWMLGLGCKASLAKLKN